MTDKLAWVLDATMGWPPCFCPIDGDPNGEFTVMIGMNLIADKPPGKLVAIIHEDGQAAADAFYEQHRAEIDEMLRANKGA
jgi:hypothetical protein